MQKKARAYYANVIHISSSVFGLWLWSTELECITRQIFTSYPKRHFHDYPAHLRQNLLRFQCSIDLNTVYPEQTFNYILQLDTCQQCHQLLFTLDYDSSAACQTNYSHHFCIPSTLNISKQICLYFKVEFQNQRSKTSNSSLNELHEFLTCGF